MTKIHVLLLTAVAIASAVALAASPTPDTPSLRLAGMVKMVKSIESTYQGTVTNIQFDSSSHKRPHYHVDLQSADKRVTRLDVDAATKEISTRDAGPLPAGSATLAEVTTLLALWLPGQLTRAELDTADGPPHYDVDVRVTGGKIARVNVDAATRWIAWRQPSVMDE